MGGHALRVNVIMNSGRQIGRSLLLLARHAAVFASLAGRSVALLVLCAKWTVALAHHAAGAFDALHYYLHRWGRRGRNGGAGAADICPGHRADAESD